MSIVKKEYIFRIQKNNKPFIIKIISSNFKDAKKFMNNVSRHYGYTDLKFLKSKIINKKGA